MHCWGQIGGGWLAGCTPVSPRTCMRNICDLCTFSPGMLTCQPQHQPSACSTPDNRLPADNSQNSTAAGRSCGDNFGCCLPHDRALQLPLPALPCSHTAQWSVHHGLCCPASFFHALLLATAARAPLEKTSSKHFASSEEQMPHQPVNCNKELTMLFYFSLRPSSSCYLVPALSLTPESFLLMKFLIFLQARFGYQ